MFPVDWSPVQAGVRVTEGVEAQTSGVRLPREWIVRLLGSGYLENQGLSGEHSCGGKAFLK